MCLMRIVSIGAGPAALYFGILMKKAVQDADITLVERNQADDTFGWGVVFSEETLDNFEQADAESMARIKRSFRFWGDIETYVRGSVVRSTGHGFCGLSRKTLLTILHDRCRELGVKLQFQREITDIDAVAREADLVVGADGANSLVRARYAETFQPKVDWRKCKFCWLGTDKTLSAFTFIFEENEHGLFQVHAYPFEEGRSTFIVECREEVWRRAGLDRASEDDTVRYCEALFAKHLGGHRLLTNRSQWRTFPTVTNARWHHDNVVIIGDAAHTAHFSIGSGTKLAMEDSIALALTFQTHGTRDVPGALAAYQEARYTDVIRTQRAAQTSLEWFENSARYIGQPPAEFNFNLMTRSKRITYDNLALRDPTLVRDAAKNIARESRDADGPEPPPPMFTPLSLRGMTLGEPHRREPDVSVLGRGGRPDGLASRPPREPRGRRRRARDDGDDERVTRGTHLVRMRRDVGDAHETAWARVVAFVHKHSSAKIGIQLAHAGRKGSCTRPWEGDRPLADDEGAWETLGPSALPFDVGWPAPREMTREDLNRMVEAFRMATKRSLAAGFDLIELHMAHGYLLSSFLSPLANKRTDAYGGSLESRARFPLEVLDAVRAAWPDDRPISVRISASDWVPEGGMTVDESVVLAEMLKAHGCDVVDVSSGGNSPESQVVYGRMYQVPFAEQIRHEAEMPAIAVGGIEGADHANTVIAAGRADLCALARPHLMDPYVTLHAAARYGYEEHPWPAQYLAVRPKKKLV